MIASMDPIAQLGMIVAFFCTIMVLLYAFGDNALFRLVIHAFIGVAAGYAGAVALRDVLIPRFMAMDLIDMVVPLLWIGMLLTKLSPRTAVLGNPASAMLVGTGAAIAIAGAIQGTLLPQISGAGNFFSPEKMQVAIGSSQMGTVFGLFLQGVIILVGTTATLISFHFSARAVPNEIPKRNRIIEAIASIGRVFVAITFGVVFAGIYSAALTALIERLDFLLDFIFSFF